MYPTYLLTCFISLPSGSVVGFKQVNSYWVLVKLWSNPA